VEPLGILLGHSEAGILAETKPDFGRNECFATVHVSAKYLPNLGVRFGKSAAILGRNGRG
jgi:hypothetical protein